MTQNDEYNTIRAVLNGNTDAFEALVLEHQNNVYSHALYILQDAQDALDASQETFLHAYKNLRNFRQESSFSVWLYRITHNCCIDILRRRHPTVPIKGENGITVDIPDFHPGPEDTAVKIETQDAVRAAAAQLPQEFREVLILREFTGLSYAEIAQIIGIETATVKTRLFRARKKLTEILQQNGNLFNTVPSDTNGSHNTASAEGGDWNV